MKALAPLLARWAALSARERKLSLAAASILGLGLAWLLLFAPALATLRAAHSSRASLDAQWQTMQRLQAQAQALQSKAPLSREATVQALRSATQKYLDKQAELSVSGDNATVTLQAASPEALAQWLSQARVDARSTPLQVQLTRAPAPEAPPQVADMPARSLRGAAPPPPAAATPAAAMGVRWNGSLQMSLPAL